MSSSAPFVSICLVFIGSPGKVCLLFLPLGSAIPENTRIFSMLNVYSKNNITCSKLTIEMLEQGMKYVQSLQ